ncbi:MAG TPA: hypothetical protein VKB05_21335 [Pyrinomonadaceae bacterium]|nr:hypothetical protein [Pyrinomonadaceae bacterium]
MNGIDQADHRAGDAMSHFVRTLREIQHLPVNFIQADERIEVLEPVVDVHDEIEGILDALIALAPIYRWSNLSSRYVLYPRDAIWDTQIGGIQITDVPRLNAATQFVTQVRSRLPELNLSEPPMLGDPRSPVYTQPVSLPSSGSIVQHLVALLGVDPRIIFTIEPSSFGDQVLHFGQV